MVTDTNPVLSIARDQGMLAALAWGAIWVQMSTIGIAGIDRVIALVAADRPDVRLRDAPVSGSTDPAERGQLTIFTSGPDLARARVAFPFDALGQHTIGVGEVGTGGSEPTFLAEPHRAREAFEPPRDARCCRRVLQLAGWLPS
jgi:3-hydroxyisobutyrate dehydrogenase